MNASTSDIPRQPLWVERDARGRFYVVGPNGRHCDSDPETLRQACERRAREMQRQAVAAAIDATVAAVVKITTAVTRRLVATVYMLQRGERGRAVKTHPISGGQ
ncbi:MAG: hypothetical protein ACREVW_11295 [Burkholderiales bacterium]